MPKPKSKPGVTKAKVKALAAAGKTTAEIADATGLSTATIAYHLGKKARRKKAKKAAAPGAPKAKKIRKAKKQGATGDHVDEELATLAQRLIPRVVKNRARKAAVLSKLGSAIGGQLQKLLQSIIDEDLQG